MKETFEREFAPFIGEKRLNIGCGGNPEPGWVNVDFNPCNGSVLSVDLRERPWPFERASFDTVMASHFLEHFRDEPLFDIVAEVGEVLKVGGFFIGVVPYATHSQAYANPFHRSLWDESTPPQFSKRLYELENTAGTGAHQFMPLVDWTVVYTGLTPDVRWLNRPGIEDVHRHGTNGIVEMQFVMRRES